MNITEFISKPTPKKLVLDEPNVIEAFGGPVEFYVLSPMPIELFKKLSSMTNLELVYAALVTEKGELVFKDGVPPIDGELLDQSFIADVSGKIFAVLGKYPGRS